MLIPRLHAPQLSGCRLISRGKELVVPATTGHEPLSEPRICVKSYLPKKCSNKVWSAPMPPTSVTPVAVFELCKNRSIMAACYGEPENCCFSSYLQVKAFCETHPTWLRGDFPTLFPFRADSYILFADAYLRPDDSISVVWDDINFRMLFAARYTPRIVVPKVKRVRVH